LPISFEKWGGGNYDQNDRMEGAGWEGLNEELEKCR